MNKNSHIGTRHGDQRLPAQFSNAGSVYIYSADNDLVISLAMFLEDSFKTVIETDKTSLLQHVQETSPTVLLVDLPSTPGESIKQLSSLNGIPRGVPVVLLRNYKSTRELDGEIAKTGASVFYKPIDVNKLRDHIGMLFETQFDSNSGGVHGKTSTQ